MAAKRPLPRKSTRPANTESEDLDLEDDQTEEEETVVDERPNGSIEGDTVPPPSGMDHRQDYPEAASPMDTTPTQTASTEALDTSDEGETAPAWEQQRFTGQPRGAVFESGEDVVIKGIQRGELIEVQEPVYRATLAPGSRRWRFHLLYSKGATITKNRTKKIGTQKTDEEKAQAWPYTVKDSGYFQA
jgi:hypothetical protein